MEKKEMVLSFRECGIIQMNADQFNCKIMELGMISEDQAKISIGGTSDNIKKLMDYTKAAYDESKKTKTV